jgi:formylglycine-generating enzyme required for sulfatase activity
MLLHEKSQLSKTGKTSGPAAKGAKHHSQAGAMFDKVLRAFEDGDLPFFDLQSTLRRLLSDSASPEELLQILRRREIFEAIPEQAHQEILRVLQTEIQANAARSNAAPAATNPDQSAEQRPAPGRTPTSDSDADETAMSRLIHALAADWDPESAANAPAATAVPDAEYKAMRVALGEREDDLAALRAEHTRVLGLLEARARSAAQLEVDLGELAEELESARSALQMQQNKVREADEALAKRIAAEHAARERNQEAAMRTEQALRSAEVLQMELQALHESVAERDAALHQARRTLADHEAALEQGRRSLSERDAALEQAHRSLMERDAKIASLQQEHAQMAPTLESRAQSAARLEAVLQAALERTAALEAELAAARTALAAEQSKPPQIDSGSAERALDIKALELQRSLDERSAEMAAQKQEHSKITAAFAARAKTLEGELKGARQRIDALTSEVKKSREMAAAPVARRVVEESPRAVPPPEAKPSVQAAGFAPPPTAARRWTRDALVRAVGACGLIAALITGVWLFAHRAPAAKVPEVTAAPAPQPGAVIRDCPTCPAFTVLPAGRFKQGSAESSSSSFVKPMHWVVIDHPIAMSTNAVTVDEFRAFIADTGRDMQGCDIYDGQWKHEQANSWRDPGFEQTAAHPVTCASWNDAKAYAQWLSAKTGQRYRLPSSSEWEYAARAGGDAPQPWNPNGSDACLNANVADLSAARRYPGWVAFACNDGYVYTAPVGSFKASAFGLNDMLGNVFQWTEDCWYANYIGAPVDGSARTDSNCAERELRGGSWFSSPYYVRADYRNHFAADYRASSVGIRLVRDITP